MKFEDAVANCTLCPELVKSRTQVVLGDGPIPCNLVFLGEAPGKSEDKQGIPFVGTSGQHLRSIAHLVKLKEKQYHILNLVKCRPPDNRDPSPEEIVNCCAFLVNQLQSVKPKVILALGRYAQAFVLNAPANTIKVIENAGNVVDVRYPLLTQIKAVLTYHPAFVLRHRNGDIDKAFRMHVRKAGKLAYDM